MFCILCGSKDLREQYSVRESHHKREEFALVKCQRCDMIQTSPRLGSSEIAVYYEEPYCNKGDDKFKSVFEAVEIFFRVRRARFINSLTPAPGRILDIGCGRGKMLSVLSERGWEAHGCELNDRRAIQARKNKNLAIYTGEFEKINFPEAYFDVITLWHVLEHLPDPKTALRKIGRILKGKGLLVIEVPNIASWQSGLFKKHWFHIDAPRHYAHFSPDTLSVMLDECGFSVRNSRVASLEYGAFSFLQSLLNSLGFENNLLYYMTMKCPDTSSFFVRKLLMCIALPFLAVISVFGAAVEALIRKGDVVRVIAVKR